MKDKDYGNFMKEYKNECKYNYHPIPRLIMLAAITPGDFYTSNLNSSISQKNYTSLPKWADSSIW